MKQKTSQYAWMRTDKIAILNSRLGENLAQKDVQRAQLSCLLFFLLLLTFFPKQRTEQPEHFNCPSAASWMKLLRSDCSI